MAARDPAGGVDPSAGVGHAGPLLTAVVPSAPDRRETEGVRTSVAHGRVIAFPASLVTATADIIT